MPGGGTVSIVARAVTVNSADGLPVDDGKYIKISISDQGPGISGDIFDCIFNPFFSTRENAGGLGLSTSYAVIRKHDGHIAAESRAGAGATFHIYLPVSVKKTTSTAPVKPSPPTGNPRILVMDDEASIRKMVGVMLKRKGFEVDAAMDGTEALEKFKAAADAGSPYDAVILDLTIPDGIGGKETVGAMREIDPKVKAIASSGYSNDPIMSDYKKYGFKRVLEKPYETRKLIQTVFNILEDQES